MADTDSVRIPRPEELIASKLKAAEHSRLILRRTGRAMTAAGAIGLAVVIAVAILEHGVLPDWLLFTLIALALAVAIVGAGCWRTAATMRMELDLFLALKWEMCQVTEAVNGSSIGRLAAMMEQNHLMLSEVKAAFGQALADMAAEVKALAQEVRARDEAYVDALSDRELDANANGHKVTRLVRPARPDSDDRNRR